MLQCATLSLSHASLLTYASRTCNVWALGYADSPGIGFLPHDAQTGGEPLLNNLDTTHNATATPTNAAAGHTNPTEINNVAMNMEKTSANTKSVALFVVRVSALGSR
jgi:hypothetical protein